MMKFAHFILISFVTFVLSSGLSAAEQSSTPHAEHAHHSSHASPGVYASQVVTATLQASASKQVLQDEVRIVFAHDAKGKTAAEVNRVLAHAIEQAREAVKHSTAFTLSSGNFRTAPSYGKDGRTDGWQGRAELVLSSKDLIAAQIAAGVLGTKLAISNIQFSLSTSKRRQEEQALLKELAQLFQNRAQAAALAFGFKTYKIVSLDLNGPSGSSHGPVLMRNAAPMPAPNALEAIKLSLEPAQVLVNLDVSGKVTFD